MKFPKYLLGLKILAAALFVAMLLAVNFEFMWTYSDLHKKVKIENDQMNYPFHVLVFESQQMQLFLMKDELDDYLSTHPDCTFLIPAGQEQTAQEQIVAAYKNRYQGDSNPILTVKQTDQTHQLIEIDMMGDPNESVFWYEAGEKAIVPKYYMRFGALPLLIIVALTLFLTAMDLVAWWVFLRRCDFV